MKSRHRNFAGSAPMPVPVTRLATQSLVENTVNGLRVDIDRRLHGATMDLTKLRHQLAPKGDLSPRENGTALGIKLAVTEASDELQDTLHQRVNELGGRVARLETRIESRQMRAPPRVKTI